MNAESDKRKPRPVKPAPAGRARSKKASDPALPSAPDVSMASRPSSNGATGTTPPAPDRAEPAPDLNGLIQERAYRLYQSSGCQQGHALEHWLEAERQIMRSLQSERAEHDRTTGENEKAGTST
jgi:Protein of unknown function (DUF2934)